MKVHFDPYGDEFCDSTYVYPCGSRVGFEYNSTIDWDRVTCKRCLSQRDSLQEWYEKTEKAICDYMGFLAMCVIEDEEEII